MRASAIAGAIREAQEEAGVPDGAVRARFTSVLDLGIWSYTTVIADVQRGFDPVISDPESVALEWVPVDEVDARPLHPGFGAAWPALRTQLEVRPLIVVDAANVVGSVPDGWWKDRAGAASRLRERLAGLAVPADALDLAGDVWFPEVSMVVEGQARRIDAESSPVSIIRADAGGDDAIVAEVSRQSQVGRTVVAVTSDRELQARLADAGAAQVRSAGWLRDLLEQHH
ncbi:NUDIX hydrolase [Microbacterium sp. Se63.02b]|uniref:NUDIX hydrolase n=1 Tax=Microbacterium sp. Se63.02b TaxID=2709304 RepID=UPI0031F71B34